LHTVEEEASKNCFQSGCGNYFHQDLSGWQNPRRGYFC
jgi:hypothetical protein